MNMAIIEDNSKGNSQQLNKIMMNANTPSCLAAENMDIFPSYIQQ